MVQPSLPDRCFKTMAQFPSHLSNLVLMRNSLEAILQLAKAVQDRQTTILLTEFPYALSQYPVFKKDDWTRSFCRSARNSK
jgi:hypothetical protein